jgi:hypothetical protein
VVLPLVSVDELLGRLQLGAEAAEEAGKSGGCRLLAVAGENQKLAHLLPRLLDVGTSRLGVTSELSVGGYEGIKVRRRVGIKGGDAGRQAGSRRAALAATAGFNANLGLNHGQASQNLVQESHNVVAHFLTCSDVLEKYLGNGIISRHIA